MTLRLPMLSTIHTPLCVECRTLEVGVLRHTKRMTRCSVCGPRFLAREQEALARLRQAAHNHREASRACPAAAPEHGPVQPS